MSIELMKISFQGFYNTWKMLDEKIDVDTPSELFIPWVVNGAFACELGLKYILTTENIAFNRTHLLHELFNLLPEPTRLELWKNLKERNSFYTDEYIQIHFLGISNAFEDFRYAHEHSLVIIGSFAKDFFTTIFEKLNTYPHYGFEKRISHEIDETEFDSKVNKALTETYSRIKSRERKKK